MAEVKKCPTCGNDLPMNSPGGHCPHCLLQLGLTNGVETEDSRSTIRIVLPSESPPAEKSGDRIGRYKLLQQLGEGGCGVVYMADQSEPVRRRVALKVIKPGMDSRQVLARFEAERQALALMDHPNIAKVLDAGATEAGRPYFVMELVKGIPITRYCDEKQLDTKQRLDLFVLVCQAIQHAHQKGIIHRDIKPSNILVADHDGTPVPKIIDFGIAKATTDQRLTDKTLFTAFEQFIGTPAYMSPEQASLSGLDVDTRSDIYSLGVLLYELLTGKTPFDARELLAKGLDEIRRVIREVEPQRPSTRLSTLDAVEQTTVAHQRHSEPPKLQGIIRGDLDWIVMKALEKDRTRRYETANGLAVDIQRHLNNEPVVARPPSNAYRFQKLVRRNKFAVAATTAVALALLLGIVVSTWQAIRATSAEREQSRLRQQAEVAEKTAQTEAAKSQQVARFLQDMLGGVGPSVALGRDTTLLREILDKTAARLPLELTNQPLAQAELLITIGRVYGGLRVVSGTNEYEIYKRALELRKQSMSESNPLIVGSMIICGNNLRGQRRFDEAEKILREALTLQTRYGMTNTVQFANTWKTIGLVLDDQGSRDEAERAFYKALEIERKIPDSELRQAELLEYLGTQFIWRGDLKKAETLLRESLETRQRMLPEDYPSIATSQYRLARALGNLAQYSEAEILCRKSVASKTKVYGASHPWTIEVCAFLAGLLDRQGKREEAKTYLLETINAAKAFPNANGIQLGDLSSKLGNIYLAEGNDVEAAKHFAQSDSSVALVNLGWLYLEGKGVKQDFARAKELSERAAALGSGIAQNNLGNMYAAGKGVPKNLEIAAEWYRKSVTNRCPAGMVSLALAHEAGEGVPKDLRLAAELYKKAGQCPESRSIPDLCHYIALFLATCPVADLRNGNEAIMWAKLANRQTGQTNAAFLDTLAAAYAEAGQFTNAVSVQREAMTLLNDDKAKADFATRLKLYEAEKPYHNTN